MAAPRQDPLRDPRFSADPYPYPYPYPAYDRLREGCPVQRIPAGSGGHHAYLITGHPEAREAFTGPRLSKDTALFFADRHSNRDLHSAISRNMPASDPPAHTRHRRVATRLFTTGRVRELRPCITRVVDDLMTAWRPGTEVDLVADLAVPLPVTVICELLGVPESDRTTLADWSHDLFDAADTDRVDATSHRIGAYLTHLVDTAHATPGDGPLHSLLRDCAEGGLDRSESVSLAALLLVAGHGIHRCPGTPLARAEVEIALRALVTRFPNTRLAIPAESLTWRPTRLTRGLTALPLTLA